MIPPACKGGFFAGFNRQIIINTFERPHSRRCLQNLSLFSPATAAASHHHHHERRNYQVDCIHRHYTTANRSNKTGTNSQRNSIFDLGYSSLMSNFWVHPRRSSTMLLSSLSCCSSISSSCFSAAAAAITAKRSSSNNISNHQQKYKRSFSSSPSSSLDKDEIILFEHGQGRNTFLRSGIGLTSFHTMYWIWYVLDFIPTVNASAVEQLHIDPMVGYTGFVFAGIVQLIACVYPARLVSKLSWNRASQQLLIYTYQMPWVTLPPSSRGPKATYRVGDVGLDPSSKDAQNIVNECGADLTRFRGHLAVTEPGHWPPFLVEIRKAGDVKEPSLLLEALLHPEQLVLLNGNSKKVSNKRIGPGRKGRKPTKHGRGGSRKKSR